MKVSVSIRKEGEWYVAVDPVTGVASQGKSVVIVLLFFGFLLFG